jgi:hypothetical protein
MTCLNRVSLAFAFRSYTTGLGSSEEPRDYWHLKGQCDVCGKTGTPLSLLACANFSTRRGSFAPCRKMWCAKCYTSDPDVSFYIKQPEDDEGVVWKRRKDTERFTKARRGDHVVCPFQCDLCIFRLLKKRDPDPSSASDRLLLACIRRASLDAFHSREKSTVEGNFGAMKRAIAKSESGGSERRIPSPGAFPLRRYCGYEVAIQMLLGLQEAGKECGDLHAVRYDSDVPVFLLWCVASQPGGRGTLLASTDERGRFSRMGSCPTQSLWFSKFLQGCKLRMGQLVIQDKAISVELLLGVLRVVDGRVSDADTLDDKVWWVSLGVYLTVGFCLSLRGPEGSCWTLGHCAYTWNREGETPRVLM